MNKKEIPVLTVVMVVMIIATALCYLLFFTPAQNQAAVVKAESSAYHAEAAAYEAYLSDASELEAQIDAAQDAIDELHDTGYINDSVVSLVISDAIQRFSISLTSVTLGEVTEIDDHRALPINLSLYGAMEDVLNFISFFENHSEGSYLVRDASMEVSNKRCTANLVVYLCTPNK